MPEHLTEDDPRDSIAPQANQQPGTRVIVKRERHEDDLPTPLAFVIAGKGKERTHAVTVATWSQAAFSHLKSLAEAFQKQNPRIDIPIVGLRGRLELSDQNSLRLDRDVGLRFRTLLWTQTDAEICHSEINEAVLGWLINDVSKYAHSEATERSVEQLKHLARTRLAVETTPRITNPYQWNVSLGKTAKPTAPSSYPDLADYVVRQLEGKMIFPQLPNLRRIVSGQLDQNQAELMTEPIALGRGGRFSLVVRVRVFTYPGRPFPVISIEFSRRIWTSGLKDKSSVQTISAYALPEDSSRAFRFTLRKVKGEDGIWSYQPDADFAPIERRYFQGAKLTTNKILKEGHRLSKCKLLVVLKHGVGERSEAKSGVPDLDKMDGFQNMVTALGEIDLQPWQGLTLIETSTRPTKDRDQHWSKRDSEKELDRKKYQDWLKEAQDSIRACYAGEHHLIIAVQPDFDVESDAKLAEAHLKEILQRSVNTTRIPLSSKVHGPRNTLPGNELKRPAERAAMRIAEWSNFIEIVKQHVLRTGRKIDGVLVIAREWYPGNLHDDSVNKRAARIALAEGLGVPVQYLRPREEFREEAERKPKRGKPKTSMQINDEIEQGFENRLMIAWLDLAYKSLGRVRPGKLLAEANIVYDTPDLFGAYPDHILALGVVRRNKSRFIANERSFLPYAIELDVETGVCSASFAYEHPETRKLVWSDALPLPHALVKLASLGPIQLTSAREDRKKVLEDRSQTFFKDRLADFGRRSLRPLIIVDADTSRSVWPWLKDEVIDPENVHLAGGFNAQAAWHHARLVRVRTDNSPKVLWDGEYSGPTEDTGEVVRYHAPNWAEAELFKLKDTVKTSVYLSFGSAIRTRLTKGKSSYREISGIKMKVIAGKQTFEAAAMERHSDAWATPSGLEIFVVRSGSDTPDQIARLVEWLRQCYAHFGDWTVKPAPLYFERVLKEYLADYDLEDDENGEGNEEA
jgi:hypothetical protein